MWPSAQNGIAWAPHTYMHISFLHVLKTNCRERDKNIINLIKFKTLKLRSYWTYFFNKISEFIVQDNIIWTVHQKALIAILIFKRPNLLSFEDNYRKRTPIYQQILLFLCNILLSVKKNHGFGQYTFLLIQT